MMKDLFSKIVVGTLSAFCLFNSLDLEAVNCPCPCPPVIGFHEDWSQGISASRWLLIEKAWGQGNNGCVPELVSIQQDTVNGVKKNVLVLTTQGNLTTSSIMGVKKSAGVYVPTNSPQRVGAGIATAQYFASGTYDVKMKIGMPNDKPKSKPAGLCASIWTFHFEEHYPSSSDPTGSQINPADPLYQPRFKEGDAADGYFSTVNSEIDAPEIGRAGAFQTASYNTYISEVDVGATYQTSSYAKLGINILDGNYHDYRFVWSTKLTPTTLTDSQVIAHGSYYYAADSASSAIQGFAVVKQADGVWYAYEGDSVVFYIDGIQVDKSTTNVSPVSGRLTIAGWFPSWVGAPNWDETKLYISEVTITPANQPGDVLHQPETYPLDGLIPPSS